MYLAYVSFVVLTPMRRSVCRVNNTVSTVSTVSTGCVGILLVCLILFVGTTISVCCYEANITCVPQSGIEPETLRSSVLRSPN
jgi:hypothetical protein